MLGIWFEDCLLVWGGVGVVQKVTFACRRVKACRVLHHYERPKQAPGDMIHSNSVNKGKEWEDKLIREHHRAPGT